MAVIHGNPPVAKKELNEKTKTYTNHLELFCVKHCFLEARMVYRALSPGLYDQCYSHSNTDLVFAPETRHLGIILNNTTESCDCVKIRCMSLGIV